MSMRCALDDNKAERGDKSLPIWNTITANDFLSRLQDIARERHTNLALVMVDFADNAVLPAEGYALDRVSLRLTAACTHGSRLLYYLFVDFYLALHDVSRLVYRRLEIITNMVKLDAAQADGVVILEPKCDRLQFWHFLYVESLEVIFRRPFKVNLFVRHVWNAPERKLAKLSCCTRHDCRKLVLFQELEQVLLLLLQETLDARLCQLSSLLGFAEILGPNILIVLQ